MKKKEEINKKEVVITKTSPKIYAIFFALLVLEAIVILSGVSETVGSYCIVNGTEYRFQAEKTKGIPWIISIFNRDGISYEKCTNGECESFRDHDLNKECFERSDLDKSIDCARRYLCKEDEESSN